MRKPARAIRSAGASTFYGWPDASPYRLRLLGAVFLLAAGSALSAPALGAAAIAPAPGSTSATAASLDLGASHPQTLAPAGAQQWFRGDVSPGISFIDLTLANASKACEVWVTLVDNEGGQIGAAVIEPGTTGVVRGLAPTAGAYFARIDGGRYAECPRAAYSLRADDEELITTATPGDAHAARSSGSSSQRQMACLGWASRWNKITKQVAVLRHELSHARGARRRSLTRKFSAVRSAERIAGRKAKSYCA